ncbi:Sterile alpha motif domain-containing protein 7 [Fukomys damarensis]|uniref:Sterile alpha motif domain-containing protein 7 n=1 Tax=Fukomys damarensis TaxID=885580 RepID=A0A091DFF4_FUKDA|nr:Sterile alpha motif domain-containing protein 7 [Fukomys damarensis]
MTNPVMTVNSLLMASGQQRIPLIPSPFGPPFVDRSELEMYAVYQQRRMEKVTTKGLTGLGVPFLHSSSFPAGPATYHGRSKLPACNLHFQRSAVLLATRPHVLQRWGQKYQPKRSTRNQKPLDSDIESSKRQEEENTLGQMPAIPYEEDDYAKHPKFGVCHNQESSETKEKLTPRIQPAVLQPSRKKPCRVHTTSLEAKPWDCGKEKPAEQESEDCGKENGVCASVPPPCLPGTHALPPPEESPPLDADIKKWTVDDVHDFIRSLPGCSEYAQIFKDHAIDGEILPLLTEEHLRGTMGLKLGPGLKIQSQRPRLVPSNSLRQLRQRSAQVLVLGNQFLSWSPQRQLWGKTTELRDKEKGFRKGANVLKRREESAARESENKHEEDTEMTMDPWPAVPTVDTPVPERGVEEQNAAKETEKKGSQS